MRFVLATALLTLVYALVLASFDPPDLLLGVLVSATLLYVTRGFVFRGAPSRAPVLARRIVAFVPLVLATTRDILRGTWEVTLVTLHVRRMTNPGVVAIPIGDRTPTGVAASALITTLSPGTFLVDVDEERGVMLIHSIHAGDPAAVREDHQSFYERYQKQVFP